MLKMRIVGVFFLRRSALVKDSWAPADISIDFGEVLLLGQNCFNVWNPFWASQSLVWEREFVIALNSSTFSADWKIKLAQLSPLVAPHKETDEADPYLCILIVCRH